MMAGDEPARFAIRLTETVRRELDQAVVWWAEQTSTEYALAWRDGLLQALMTLSTFPDANPIAPESERFAPIVVRQLLYRQRPRGPVFRVLFTVLHHREDQPIIRVLHLRHGAARWLGDGDLSEEDRER